MVDDPQARAPTRTKPARLMSADECRKRFAHMLLPGPGARVFRAVLREHIETLTDDVLAPHPKRQLKYIKITRQV